MLFSSHFGVEGLPKGNRRNLISSVGHMLLIMWLPTGSSQPHPGNGSNVSSLDKRAIVTLHSYEVSWSLLLGKRKISIFPGPDVYGEGHDQSGLFLWWEADPEECQSSRIRRSDQGAPKWMSLGICISDIYFKPPPQF